MAYFMEPMSSPMYWIDGAPTVKHTTMHRGAVVPTNPLVTEITMSQLSQQSQDEALVEEEASYYRLDETQAYSTLLPTFKKIVSVTDRNSKMLDKAFKALRYVYTNLLAEVGGMCGERLEESSGDEKSPQASPGKKRFQSSNIALDNSRSNKRIRPIGERENRMY